jgi:hypothetical protein
MIRFAAVLRLLGSAETSRRLSCDAGVICVTHRKGKAEGVAKVLQAVGKAEGVGKVQGVGKAERVTKVQAVGRAERVAIGNRVGGEILSVGRRTRTISPALRRALEIRDHGCRFPGCGLRFTDAHHVKHWADGGETSLENCLLLCRHHHRFTTREGGGSDGGALVDRSFTIPEGGLISTGEVRERRPPPPPASRRIDRTRSAHSGRVDACRESSEVCLIEEHPRLPQRSSR